jgi:hypothetical protein
MPSVLVWLAQQFITIGAIGFYIIAVIRIAFGLLLISVAPASRAPRAVRVLGYVILVLGVATALTGLVGIGHGQAAIEWWLKQGPGVFRLTAVFVFALGGFIVFTCAPRRTA